MTLGQLRWCRPRHTRWTVNDLEWMNALMALGVDGITTDNLAVMELLGGQSGGTTRWTRDASGKTTDTGQVGDRPPWVTAPCHVLPVPVGSPWRIRTREPITPARTDAPRIPIFAAAS